MGGDNLARQVRECDSRLQQLVADVRALAIIAYTERLRYLPAYLQQLVTVERL